MPERSYRVASNYFARHQIRNFTQNPSKCFSVFMFSASVEHDLVFSKWLRHPGQSYPYITPIHSYCEFNLYCVLGSRLSYLFQYVAAVWIYSFTQYNEKELSSSVRRRHFLIQMANSRTGTVTIIMTNGIRTAKTN